MYIKKSDEIRYVYKKREATKEKKKKTRLEKVFE
jgi:hypothetical protein